MSRIIILEGPDGAGKSTLAAKIGEVMGVTPVHFSREAGVRKSVGRIYVDAMTPALLGLRDVVLDRCWLSEFPYAEAFWQGDNRLSIEQIRMLERIAMRCETTVIRCDPGWETVKANYLGRKELEMLENEEQLKMVYDIYKTQKSALPTLVYDYRIHDEYNPRILYGTRPHLPGTVTAGNLSAKTLVVTPELHNITDFDSFLRYPAAAFSGAGNSRWITEQFEWANIGEERLLWCPMTHLDDVIKNQWNGAKILALGPVAASACRERGWSKVVALDHPTTWRLRDKPYPTAYPVEAL